jgi:hypothetical protein
MAQHLFTCPHCNEPSIPTRAKYWARPHDPAVCRFCNKASSISDAIESASALLYFIAGIIALGIFGWQVTLVHRDAPVIGPSPVTLLLSLLLFYVAVQTAKMFWVPLKALSDTEVDKKKSTMSTSNKIVNAVVILFFITLLLGKCGF